MEHPLGNTRIGLGTRAVQRLQYKNCLMRELSLSGGALGWSWTSKGGGICPGRGKGEIFLTYPPKAAWPISDGPGAEAVSSEEQSK